LHNATLYSPNAAETTADFAAHCSAVRGSYRDATDDSWRNRGERVTNKMRLTPEPGASGGGSVTNKISVLMPYPEQTHTTELRLAPRVDSLRGCTVGIVNNSWHCMNLIVDEYRRVLVETYGVTDIVEKRISAAQKLPVPDVEEMATRCDAAIVGIGN
jgi:hypothetical protein